jgi:SAM-dependent methyltransferase
MRRELELTRTEMDECVRFHYGNPDSLGPNPRLWRQYAYYLPDDFYEAMVSKLVQAESLWLDIGCGRDLFPNNPSLAKTLSSRCALLVGLDPDDNIQDNRWLHEAVKGTLHEYRPNRKYHLVTLRMVAEHLTDPQATVESLARLTRPGGKVILFTVFKWSPTAVLARLVPFHLHHGVKRLLWQTEERDTFPVAYRMNTRSCLDRLFAGAGFQECYFAYLPDCRLFAQFRILHRLELSLWRLLETVGLPYPECCLLAVYERMHT